MVKEEVAVVLYIHRGIIYDIAVFRNVSAAIRYYDELVTEAYGSPDAPQEGDDYIDWQIVTVIAEE